MLPLAQICSGCDESGGCLRQWKPRRPRWGRSAAVDHTALLQVVGERHSGTNFLTHLLQHRLCLHVPNTLWKHGIFDDFEQKLDKQTGYVHIAQDPYAWLVANYHWPVDMHMEEVAGFSYLLLALPV